MLPKLRTQSPDYREVAGHYGAHDVMRHHTFFRYSSRIFLRVSMSLACAAMMARRRPCVASKRVAPSRCSGLCLALTRARSTAAAIQ